ncbi:protein kinase [Actinoplanes sp. GCM10030250]|uniref:serine/threonine-protein kinase n=1 Tax=Actinoplanes sp. GCM10030250 TaxID=3273376 RepID=UPI00360B1A44
MSDGDRIGRYQLWEEIGRGACTLVRRATVPGAPPIAAKLLRPDLARNARVRELLTRIGGSLQHLPHDGIVRMHDLVVEYDQVALIVDFVDGPSLRAFMAGEGGTLPLDDAAVVAVQVADVLTAAHARGLVHLDLKPENVLLVGGAYPLRVKVCDFGMAALPDEPDSSAYAAPELAAGDPPTTAADVYAFGLMLAEMTSGTRPEPGRSGLQRVPHQVRDLVRDCLATHPWERPSAGNVAARIRAAVVSAAMPIEPSPAWPPPESPQTRNGPDRRRTALIAGAAGVAAAAVLIGFVAWPGAGDDSGSPGAAPSAAVAFGSAPEASAGPGPTVERQKVAAAAPVRATYAAHLPEDAGTLSLAVRDGRAIAYLCDGNQIEAWLKGPVTGDQVSLTGRDGASLTGTLDRQKITGTVSHGERRVGFTLPRVTAPSGLYRAAARLRNAEIKGGWIVLPDGTQVGVLTTDGVPAPAPSLNLANRTAVRGVDTVPAVPVDVATGTGF